MPAILLLLAVIGVDVAQAQLGLVAPERQSGWQEKPSVRAQRHMVAAANPLAADAGREILRLGGSSVDAAIAVQLVLGLVEPQSSGLGGGAFLLHWDARARAIASFDGRETAPAGAEPDRLMVDGRPMPFRQAVKSPLSIGVPGTVRLLELAHRRHGTLAWATLFQPAIRLAENGFPVSPRLAGMLAKSTPQDFSPEARVYFFDGEGRPWPTGHKLANPEYAETLKRIAATGADGFYRGPIAEAVVSAARVGAARIGAPAKGSITIADLRGYRAVERPAVCVAYRRQRVCSMGPPSSGGHALGQALGMLEAYDLGSSPGATLAPSAMHAIAEATKLAFADRNHYLADPDFVDVPAGLLAPSYIAERRRLIAPGRPIVRAYPGTPPASGSRLHGADETVEIAGTSHVSIIDAAGNAVAMTTTVEGAFGSGHWAAGFLLNNELTDFSFRPVAADGRPIANRIEGGKRPRSSMSPTIVLDERGQAVIVTGSAGGSRIIGYVLKTLVALIDWRLDAADALALPHFGSRGATFEIEQPEVGGLAGFRHPAGPLAIVSRAIALKPHGHAIQFDVMTSGTQVIVRRADGWLEGAADPRREGIAIGD